MAIPFKIGEMMELAMGKDRMIIAEAVRRAVQAAGSTAKLAGLCKVSPSTISRLQIGICKPKKRTIEHLYSHIAPFLPEDIWLKLADSKRSRIIIRRSNLKMSCAKGAKKT